MAEAVRLDVPGEPTVWHVLTAEGACEQLAVDPRHGLEAVEVGRRREQVGPNKLAEAKKEPGWQAFLRQYRDLMQLVLLGAAIVSIVALQEFSTGLVILGLTVLNAVLGLNQEGKAAESVAALQKMLIIRAHARRAGELVDVAAEELVPGDVVVFEAGDKIPADGRLLVAATLEIEEAALTGESIEGGRRPSARQLTVREASGRFEGGRTVAGSRGGALGIRVDRALGHAGSRQTREALRR